MLTEKFAKRFNELEEEYKTLPFENKGATDCSVSAEYWKKWAVSSQSLIKAVFSEDSPHCIHFDKSFEKCWGYEFEVSEMQGIFRSAKEDFEGGYVFNVELQVSGEVFGDFVALAKQSLAEGHKDVAAVLASAALEDALKRFATLNGLDVDGKNMTEVVNALKSKGLVAGAQKTLLDTMPKIRDYAMHANWEKLSEPEVNSVIGFVEQFLLSNFS